MFFLVYSATRKTDKGLPKYQDEDESDVFILSGAEDLVPALVQDRMNHWLLFPAANWSDA